MDVKSILAKHGVENAELQAELDELVRITESKNPENWKRFKKSLTEVEELKADNAELQVENEHLKGKLDQLTESNKELSGFKTRLAEYESKEAEKIKQKHDKVLEVITKGKDDPLYDKVSKIANQFTIPTEDEELSKDKMLENIRIFDVLDSTGYFETEDIHDKGSKAGGGGAFINPFNPETYSLMGQINLKRQDPVLYEKLKKEARK